MTTQLLSRLARDRCGICLRGSALVGTRSNTTSAKHNFLNSIIDAYHLLRHLEHHRLHLLHRRLILPEHLLHHSLIRCGTVEVEARVHAHHVHHEGVHHWHLHVVRSWAEI